MSGLDEATRDALLRAHGAAAVTAALAPYVTDARKERIEAVLGARMRGVQVAIEQPSDPHNAAAVVRTAEAFGAYGVHVIAAEGRALHARGVTQGANHWIETQAHATLDAFLGWVGEQGVAVYGAWMDAPLAIEAVPVDRPLCLLFGNESRGLSARARAACQAGFRIPMVGMSESLNLSVSAAVSLYDVLRRRRAAVGPGDLDPMERERLRARSYMGSLDPRLVLGLLPLRTDRAVEPMP